jgi:CDP-glucose 4,6-dehydratase
MNRQFWKGKNVLITGFEGFVGSNLTKALVDSGANIIGLDIKVMREETLLERSDYRKIKVIKGSVANYRLLKDTIVRSRIDVVFHLAAEAIVGTCYKMPLRAFSTNIQGSWNILEACRRSETVSSIVIASSDKAYGSHNKLPYNEGSRLVGKHPYDVSKSCADLIALAYFHTYGLPVSITRCGNIYGPGDFNFSRIVPDLIRSVFREEKFLIRSNGRFTRDYIFIDDIVSGYLLIAEKLQELFLAGKAFNLSNESPISVLELVKKVYNSFGKKQNFEILDKADFEIEHQYLSSEKARTILGWTPVYSLDRGIKKTIPTYKKYASD